MSRIVFENLPSTNTPLNANNLNSAFLENVYPIGSIHINNENTSPASKLGGTWTLVNKVFTPLGSSSSNIFTRNTTNTSDVSAYMTRNGQSIGVYLAITTAVDLGDTSVDLGTIDFSFIGISRTLHSYNQVHAGSDDGNGIALLTMNYLSGEVQGVEVITKTSGGVIPAGSTLYAQFNIVSTFGYMLDSACNQFIWRRTA